MDWKFPLNHLFEDFRMEELLDTLTKNPAEIPMVISLIEIPPQKTAWRAAWIIDHLNQHHPAIVSPYLPELTRILKKTTYNGARRSLLKILVTSASNIEDGELLDKCFQWVCSPAIPIAVRAYAMQYIYDLLPKYPELTNEFCLSLETAIHDKSKGVKGKARKLLNKINKVTMYD